MITDIADYFAKGCGRCDRFATPACSTQRWAQGLADLRRVCITSGLVETVKWGHPCYTHQGRNIAILGAFRGDFRITFFNAALMKDPEKLLETQGPNTQHASMVRFAENGLMAQQAPIIRAYLAEAIGYAQSGIKPPKVQCILVLPAELVAVMAADPPLAVAFNALTPGRQRSYVIGLGSAKTSVTRSNRITKFRAKILAGKGATEQ